MKREVEKLFEVLPELDYSKISQRNKLFTNSVFKFTVASKIGAGDVFGELGLIRKKGRSATILVTKLTHFAVMDKEHYTQILMEEDIRRLNKSLNFLTNTILKEISKDHLSKIVYLFTKRTFQCGQEILRIGDFASEVFLIKKGNVEIIKNVKEINTEGNLKYSRIQKNRVATIGPGEFFGVDDIILNRLVSSQVMVTSAFLKVQSISRIHFLKIINEYPMIFFLFKKSINIKETYHEERLEKSKLNGSNFLELNPKENLLIGKIKNEESSKKLLNHFNSIKGNLHNIRGTVFENLPNIKLEKDKIDYFQFYLYTKRIVAKRDKIEESKMKKIERENNEKLQQLGTTNLSPSKPKFQKVHQRNFSLEFSNDAWKKEFKNLDSSLTISPFLWTAFNSTELLKNTGETTNSSAIHYLNQSANLNLKKNFSMIKTSNFFNYANQDKELDYLIKNKFIQPDIKSNIKIKKSKYRRFKSMGNALESEFPNKEESMNLVVLNHMGKPTKYCSFIK